jgi:hypothetical protein
MDISEHVRELVVEDVRPEGAEEYVELWPRSARTATATIKFAEPLSPVGQERVLRVRHRGKQVSIPTRITRAGRVGDSYELAFEQIGPQTVERVGRRRGWRKHVRREKARARRAR